MDIIKGYKAFNKDRTNRYGMLFEEGKTYTSEGDVSFGNNSTGGYHMCVRLEDTLRYFNAMTDDIEIAKVIGSGRRVEYEDDYYGYYDMFSVENIKILKFLTRKEIITMFLDKKMYEHRACRFVQLYKLNKEERLLFRNRYYNSERIQQYISYYQEKDDDAFVKKHTIKK